MCLWARVGCLCVPGASVYVCSAHVWIPPALSWVIVPRRLPSLGTWAPVTTTCFCSLPGLAALLAHLALSHLVAHLGHWSCPGHRDHPTDRGPAAGRGQGLLGPWAGSQLCLKVTCPVFSSWRSRWAGPWGLVLEPLALPAACLGVRKILEGTRRVRHKLRRTGRVWSGSESWQCWVAWRGRPEVAVGTRPLQRSRQA